MSFERFVTTYLNFTTREKKGIAALLLIILLLYFLPDLLYKEKDYSSEIRAFEKKIAQMDSVQAEESENEYVGSDYPKPLPIRPFYFNPNTVDPQQLTNFGLPRYIIDRFTKYRNSGAKFYKKEDFKKLYGLKPDLYNKMAPFIVIRETKYLKENDKIIRPDYKKPEPENHSTELNTADSASLINVRGIGPYLCSKILKYRNALGGFVKFEQLYEIYNIKPDQVDLFKPFVHIDPKNIHTMKINTADYNQLNGHPYISVREANAIINYRKQHGIYKSKADLEKVYLLSRETLDKIEPYLEF